MDQKIIILDEEQFSELRNDIKAIKDALISQGKIAMPKQWLTAKELSELLGIQVRSVYNYRAKGIIKGQKPGGVLLFSYSEIEALLSKK